MGVEAPPRKLFPNWTKVSLRTTHDWRTKFKRANEKHSSEQVLHFPFVLQTVAKMVHCIQPRVFAFDVIISTLAKDPMKKEVVNLFHARMYRSLIPVSISVKFVIRSVQQCAKHELITKRDSMQVMRFLGVTDMQE